MTAPRRCRSGLTWRGARRDPDSVVLCLLATDEEDEGDIALQIHFTLIQAFCCDNDIHILRLSGMQRLAEILGEPEAGAEPRDLHCLLVTVSGTVRHGRTVIHGGRRARHGRGVGDGTQGHVLGGTVALTGCSGPSEPAHGRLEEPRAGGGGQLLRREPRQEPVGALRLPAGALSWPDPHPART